MHRQTVYAAILGGLLALWPLAGQTQDEPPSRQCAGRVLCRYTETNLADAYGVPLTIQGISFCAQFCSADYWVRHTNNEADLLQFGHGGAMGPPLLALGPFGTGPQGAWDPTRFQLRRIVWVAAPNARAIDDGRYEETTFTWDGTRGELVQGATRGFMPEQLEGAVGELESAGLQFLLPRQRW
jgi:hypothetical protein